MSTLCFFARYEDSSGDGVDGLTPTWDVEQITRSTGARTALVTGGATSITIGRRGLYGYVLTNADLVTYDYVATAITASSTPTVHEVAALWTLWSLSWHDILTSALTAVGSIGKLFTDYIDAAISSRSDFDESTDGVFPAASAISASSIAADAFTAIEGNVWSASSRTLTQAGASVVSAVMGAKVTVQKDTYWDVTLTGLTSDLTDNDEVYLALKKKVEYLDAQAGLLVSRTGGIERLNAASTGFTASDAVLTVESSTSVRLLLSGSSACVAAGEYTYTVKRIAAASSTGERYLASTGGVWDVDYPGVDEVI